MAPFASTRGRRRLLLPAVALVVALVAVPVQACFPRTFSFGDSLTDTGNYRFVFVNDTRETALRPPYGQTFFHRATGRFSDGRLIVDFIADALGLPFVRPYWKGKKAKDFAFGANFAVGSAMALSPEFFRAKGVPMGDRVHLDMEMKWFRDLLQLLCPGGFPDCWDLMNESLFLVGEIGGNDYNIPLLTGVPFDKISTFPPSVVAKISSTITELIWLGAKNLVVPGNLPIGCIPKYLVRFQSNNKDDYEPDTGCLRWMNEFSEYHNELLMVELDKLRMLHPDVTIIYADYYGAAMEVFRYPEQFGIKEPLVACCGGRGPYGITKGVGCGYGDYKVCDNPDKYGSWDGLHPTEAVYMAVAMDVLQSSSTRPLFSTSSCPQLTGLGSCTDEHKALDDM